MLDQIGNFLASAHSFYLFFAVTGSVFFVFQLFSTLLGGGLEHDCDSVDAPADVHGHGGTDLSGLKFLTVKGIISFFTFFGWAGFFWGKSGWGGFLISLCCGLLMMALTALVLFLLLKMQQSGNIPPQHFIGCRGIVYLTLPGNRKHGGKVTVTLPNCTRQMAAVSDFELTTGTPVEVVEVLSGDLLLVKAL